MSTPLQALKSLRHVGRNSLLGVCTKGSAVRGIKVWVRPVIHALNRRREAEEFRSVYPIKPRPRYEYTDWNYNAELYAFGKRLGENFDEALLRQALTDRSYIHLQLQKQEELGLKSEGSSLPDNEFMASEGANLLRSVVLSILAKEFPKLPEEGLRAVYDWLTSESSLAEISSLLGTKDLIMCKEYPPAASTFVTAFLALLSALEKSSGSPRVEKFIIDFVMTRLCGQDVFELWEISTPWSMLTEILARQGQGPPEPRIISQVGSNTILAAFVVGLYTAEKKLIGQGIGETLEIAQEMAARDALRDIFGLKKPKNGFDFLAGGNAVNNLSKKQVKALT